ncbi:MAG: hypothetical protein K9K32_07245 [Halanaerobiales bacterium]|nr:hypothetical protein [Halanaerobiales bacterium]
MQKVYCDKCEGKGYHANYEVNNGNIKENKKGECSKCKGLGFYFISDRRDRAHTFHGSLKGYVPYNNKGNKLNFDIDFNEKIIEDYRRWLEVDCYVKNH